MSMMSFTLAAMLMMQSVYIGAYLPWLLMVALLTGFATGAAGAGVLRVVSAIDFKHPGKRSSGG